MEIAIGAIIGRRMPQRRPSFLRCRDHRIAETLLQRRLQPVYPCGQIGGKTVKIPVPLVPASFPSLPLRLRLQTVERCASNRGSCDCKRDVAADQGRQVVSGAFCLAPMPVLILKETGDQGYRAFSPPTEALGEFINVGVKTGDAGVRLVALRFIRFDSSFQFVNGGLHGIHFGVGWRGCVGPPILRIFLQRSLEAVENGQSQQAFDAATHLLAHALAGVALYLFAIEEKELRKGGLQEVLGDPVAIPVVPVFDAGGRSERDPALALVYLKLIVAALVLTGSAEVPSPLDFYRFACFVLPFELDDTLRGAGVQCPVMQGAFEKPAVADVDALLTVAMRLRSRPRL